MSSWLIEAIRASKGFDSPGSSIHVLKEPDLLHDPRFYKIVAGVRFTQGLILTYHAVIFVILLCFTAIHWAEKSYYSRQRARSDKKRNNKIDEDTPLIEASSVERTSYKSLRPGWTSRIRGFLMYQPRPIPIINKTLPSNGASLCLLAFVGLNIFYLLFNCPLSLDTVFIFGDRAAALFAANLPLLYLFAAKNQPIKLLTGRSYESLNIIHRRLGEWLCLLALFHAISMVLVWSTILEPLGWSFAFYLSGKIVLLGLFAFICYETLYLTSLGSFRQRWYELFLVSHVVLQFAALILVFFHHPRSRIPVAATFAIYIIDRVVFRLWLSVHWTTATLTVLEDNETLKISAKWALPASPSTATLLTPSVKHGWKATEHVFVTIPALSRRHLLQAHPFSIMSSPPYSSSSSSSSSSSASSSDDEIATLNLLVRAQDGFSRDALHFAHRNPGLPVQMRLDGAYGSQTAVEKLSHKDTAILFAGGSGIAVVLPLVHALLSHGYPRGTIHLVWTVRYDSQRSWLDASEYALLREAGVDLILPPSTAAHGRPPLEQLLQSCLDLSEVQGGDGGGRLDSGSSSSGSIGVVTSGPDAMNRQVRNACATLVATYGLHIDVIVEKFGW